MSLSGNDLIEQFELYFDGADHNNASLYLCVDSDMNREVQIIIAALREKGLWSAEKAKTVPPEHKSMYAEQMQFIGYIPGQINDKTFYVAAYNHEKFPHHEKRWQDWQTFISSNFKL